MKIGVSIAMFDSGGYWLVGRWAGVIKDHKTRQKSQFPLELLLGAMENEEKWCAELAWENNTISMDYFNGLFQGQP